MSSNRKSIAYDEISVVLAAGAYQKNIQAFDWIEVISTDNDTLEISINDGASFARARNGIMVRPGGGINGNVILRNPSGSTINATLATGTAEMDDNRLVLAGTGILPVSMSDGNIEGIVAGGASAAAVKPVIVGGVDLGGNARKIQTDGDGNQKIVGTAAIGVAPAASDAPVIVGALKNDGTARALHVDNNDFLKTSIDANNIESLCFALGMIGLATTAISVYANPAKLTGYIFHNTGGSDAYISFYNAGGAPNAGTNRRFVIKIPAGEEKFVWFGDGLSFGTGTWIRVTALVADGDDTAHGAADILATVFERG